MTGRASFPVAAPHGLSRATAALTAALRHHTQTNTDTDTDTDTEGALT